jgi:hypothetical protein
MLRNGARVCSFDRLSVSFIYVVPFFAAFRETVLAVVLFCSFVSMGFIFLYEDEIKE